MLRANRIQTFNPTVKNQSTLDHFFAELGGTSFRNCFSPAPDTPRSLACLYTGLYPKSNGCKKRINWPKYYLYDTNKTIFDLFKSADYDMFANFTDFDLSVGYLPSSAEKDINIASSFEELLALSPQIISSPNSFTFVNLPDYHVAVSDFYSHSSSDSFGQTALKHSFDTFFSNLDVGLFDYIFIFSDHGCKLSDDLFNHDLDLIDDDRSQICLFVHKKGDIGISSVDSLVSICDFFPTISDLLDINPLSVTDGVSLLSPVPNRSVVIEDHKTFIPAIADYPQLWALRTDSYLFQTNLRTSRYCHLDLFNKDKKYLDPPHALLNESLQVITDLSAFYSELSREDNILSYYQTLKDNPESYSVSPPPKLSPTFIFYIRFSSFLKKLPKLLSISRPISLTRLLPLLIFITLSLYLLARLYLLGL